MSGELLADIPWWQILKAVDRVGADVREHIALRPKGNDHQWFEVVMTSDGQKELSPAEAQQRAQASVVSSFFRTFDFG